jgi:hypothetical protein
MASKSIQRWRKRIRAILDGTIEEELRGMSLEEAVKELGRCVDEFGSKTQKARWQKEAEEHLSKGREAGKSG